VFSSRPIVRVLLGLAVACGGAVALVGGLYVRGPGLIAVWVTGALVGCLAAGIAREAPGSQRTAPLDAAVQAGGWTMLALLILSGTAVVSTGVVVVAVGAAMIGVLVVRTLRGRRAGRATRPAPGSLVPPATDAVATTGPVPALSTRALGREWLRTTALLAGGLAAADRAALVRRRQEVLDELERRDPVGFGQWLGTAGPGCDPADYVRGERTAGTDAA
jgi:hypothetical protein